MAFDGVLIHYLLEELNTELVNKRISKVISINDYEYVLACSNKAKLFISLNPNNPHIRLSSQEFINSNTLLTPFWKKHIEGGIINSLTQYHNDRIIIINVVNTDELGYQKYYNIILELTGKNTNLIITDDNYFILEALKKTSLSDQRLIQVKAKYEFLTSEKVNPFTNQGEVFDNIFEGVSSLLFNEITYTNSLSTVLNRKVNPVIIKTEKKTFFYVFDLNHLIGEREFFSSISSMLETYYIKNVHETIHNNEQRKLNDFVVKELNKLKNKLMKQENELQEAHKLLSLEQTANILASNIHLVKPRQTEITCFDFYNNQEITIKLDPNIRPNDNVNVYFNKYKKAKRTITTLTETIKETKNDIAYYECLLQQTDLTNINDLREILDEVGISKSVKKNTKPNILKLEDDYGNLIFVGKNNLQNEYLTHTLAHSNDYFFHVASFPGSHVIFRGTLTDEAIKLAATIAAYYSKATSTVSVDYTLVKWVKKVKGMKGSFVTYTNQKSVHADPDINYINKFTHPCK